ncbi:hypothetical protein HAALTHF_18890n [Vreelandella aquamarina]|nr:hypothetical protein HAALTHF_18890n [Halomonas axialensis]
MEITGREVCCMPSPGLKKSVILSVSRALGMTPLHARCYDHARAFCKLTIKLRSVKVFDTV